MLCFIMALKSPAASANWSAVERVFEQTLTSVCSQTDPDFRVIVVCNQLPRLQRPPHASVRFLLRDLPVPSKKTTMLDKWTKLAHGLVVAGEFAPDFVMLMDADDLVSNQLSAFANRNRQSNGWIFKRGYYWSYGSRFAKLSNDFNCGTNAIVNSRYIRFPKTVDERSRLDCIILKNGHTTIEAAMRHQGTPLDPLPFPGAVYVAEHGDNDTTLSADTPRLKRFRSRVRAISNSLSNIKQQRFITDSLRREFGLPRNA
jgi:hypothetical protein